LLFYIDFGILTGRWILMYLSSLTVKGIKYVQHLLR
jgi:hypothetical protein